MIIIVDENDECLRLDNYLSRMFADISRTKIQDFIKDGKVLVNGKIKKPAFQLQEGDRIEFEKLEEEISINPQNIALDIVYEDENMLAVNKPSGMLTHPTASEREDTLVNALLYKYGYEGLSDINGELRPGIVHRLDRNTSGLLMIAKNNPAHEFLAAQIKERKIKKCYRAVLKGNYGLEEERIDLPIGRHPKCPYKMAVVPEKNGGKPAVTIVKVLEHFRDATYVKITLVTGRTHQIRVHMSYKRHPVYNDTLYFGGGCKVKTQEQVLQSYYLMFTKPFTDEIINLEIEPDEKINKVLTYYRSNK